jgi:hypothetical protein
MPSRDHLQPVADTLSQDVEIVQQELAFADLPMAMWSPPADCPQELRQLHASLVDSLRRDARHIPAGVVGAMQCERLAAYYIEIRHREMSRIWPSAKYREHLYKLYRDASNDLVSGYHSNKIAPETLHQIVSSHTAKIVATVLQSLPREQAKPLYQRFAEALDEAAEPA